ncbi:MAG TPA: L-threonylcarbamoyladenylate synthase [Cyclobacteriaceae bacterium]|nr:L-threonylcarbamoyladenylate synthase [Cyclobacteriaceae bacterium]
MAEIGTDINKAAALLKSGNLVAIPTETVYGLAGNALDVEAVSRIFAVKNRPRFDPIIVHVTGLDQAAHHTTVIPEGAAALAEAFWPGPLTLLLKKNETIPDLVTAGMPHVGIRVPAHPLTQQLLEQLPFPLAAPSANPFGYISPTRPEHVNEQLGDRIGYILDGGPCSVGIESTIIGFDEKGQAILYRLGGLSLSSIEALVGKVVMRTSASSDPRAPGQLKSHYAPAKPFVVGDLNKLLRNQNVNEVAVLSFSKSYDVPHQFVLSPQGNVEEAARNLFTAMRTLEKMPVKLIVAEFVPDEGLGKAINDRLTRAAAKEKD